MRTVLVIDDSEAVIAALSVLFSLREIRTLDAHTPEEGLAALDRHDVDLVISDMNFSADTTSGNEGVELFRRVRDLHPDLPVILLTAWGSLETAVELVKAGAADYLTKPWDNDRLMASVENLLALSQARRELATERLRRRQRIDELRSRYDLCGIVFASDAMQRALEMACRVARAEVPVLVTGPSGAGKERVAQVVHANSGVKDGPFVALNCGAMPADLLEAELFGAESGAYTGASKARPGRFELADGGTLFLDEIGNLPLSGQVKLLRVLDTGQYQRLGSGVTRTARVRIVSATNADLPRMVADGSFREDLYYRLNVIEVAVPPLAERPEDVPVLAAHFLGTEHELAADAVAALQAYGWPGNVRELRNAIERARLLAPSATLHAADLNLPQPGRAAAAPEPDREPVEAALRAAEGNVSRAARMLGLSRQALYRRMSRRGGEP